MLSNVKLTAANVPHKESLTTEGNSVEEHFFSPY